MMTFPEQADAAGSAFRLAFKHFQRVEGIFRVNPKARVDSVQVRVYETGSDRAESDAQRDAGLNRAKESRTMFSKKASRRTASTA